MFRTKVLSVSMNFIVCQWLRWRFKVNFGQRLDGVYLNSALYEVQLLRAPTWPGWWGEWTPQFGASGSGGASLSPARGDGEHRGLVGSAQKTASIWWCCCGCSLKFLCRGMIQGESFQANSIMNQCITSSSFLSLWHACCFSWVKCCWKQSEGREDLKERRQEDPDMNLSHPQNACINWLVPA